MDIIRENKSFLESRNKVLRTIDLIFLISMLVFFPFSPYFSYFFGIVFLLFSRANKQLLYFVFLLGLWSQFFVLNSRNYIVELEHDLSSYYNAYLYMLNMNPLQVVEAYSPEFGWYFIYKFIGIINSNLTEYDIAIINTLICDVAFSFWLYLHGIRDVSSRHIGIVLGLSLLFLWPNNFAFFQRQSISVIFLLFSLSNVNRFHKFAFYLFVAGIFHITSFFIGVVYFIIQKNRLSIKQFIFFVVVALIGIRVLFDFGISYISSSLGFETLARKSNFYLGNGGGFLALSELRFFPLFLFIIIFFKNIDAKWKKIAIFTTVFYISLLGIQFASGRMNFILFYLYGLFLYLSLKNNYKVLVMFALSYLLFDLLYKSGIVFSINDTFWQRYDFFEFMPFYYVK